MTYLKDSIGILYRSASFKRAGIFNNELVHSSQVSLYVQ